MGYRVICTPFLLCMSHGKEINMKHRIVLLTLAAMLCFTACTSVNTPESAETTANTPVPSSEIPQEVWVGSDVYEVIPLIPETGPYAGETLIHNEFIPAGFFTTEEEIIFKDWDKEAYACYIESFDWDGNHLGRSVDVQPEPLALLKDTASPMANS